MTKRAVRQSRKILVVCHDIGGAQAVFPVIQRLKIEPDTHVDVVAGHFAHKLFDRFSPEIADADWSEQEIDQFLERTRPQLFLTSTSWKSSLEQGFRNRAHLLGVPSVVLIDFWSNYRLRWQYAAYRYEESKDHVCVMDRRTARAMQKEGYPTENIHVTGQPHLEKCLRQRIREASRSGEMKRKRVLLLSNALSALGLEDDPTAPIRVICKALAEWYARTNTPIVLSIRQHPHEKTDPDFLTKAQGIAPQGVTIRLADRTKPIRGQIQSNDVILGYVTMALFEARCLGKRAIAVELANYPPELAFAMKEAGIILASSKPDSIVSCLMRREAHNHVSRLTYQGATSAVVKLCLKLIPAND
jgi:hypothetical protein